MKDEVKLTLPNLGEVIITSSVVSKWNIDETNIIGDTVFCKTKGSTFSMSIEEYNKVFKQ